MEIQSYYAVSPEDRKKLDNNFTYHSPQNDQPKKYEVIRDKAKEFAELLLSLCPGSRELSLAITKLEEVVFWSNAAVARNSGEG